ncbi:DUF3727 domain-containing protein [Synechococcus sp. PCC 6312]|uniref:DUF3727 domain-containing protein n=1 Tax=Synechococcus sp. (strain ATCC 27167 / PCC 6312) TaxID=195253 RepID=UPI00029F0119|nr:DUF3727 domain-containing protein [Synechococcus sp. PCC 6312]AFY59836.1 Protein of unknown function (DUF3727)/Protein of unknown function (DUF1292) [Synechococcus sp. PCC 6312]
MGRNNTGQNNNSEWSPTDPQQEREQVTLLDEFGRALDCFIEFSLKFSDQEYALLQPIDFPVEIFVVLADSDDEETLIPLEDEDIDPVFDIARAILAEQNLMLKRTAHFLTVEGEVPLADEVEIVTFEEDEGSEQEEEYQPLGSKFFHQDREYAIYMPLSPMLLVARLRPGHKPEVLSPQDFQHIQPLIEEHLEKHLVDWVGDEEEDW